MTREEERINCATAFANAVTDGVQDSYFDIVMKTHLDATKWADRTIIDKACKWLKSKSCFGYIEDVNADEFIEDFKQAMEE